MKCKLFFALIVCLTLCSQSANAQVYITDFKTQKIEKEYFPEYETKFTAYYNEDGMFYVEDFSVKIEFPETELISSDDKEQVRAKIATILLNDATITNQYEIEKQSIEKHFLAKYNQHLVRGNVECEKFLEQVKATNEDASSDLFWEPSFYGRINGELIFYTNSFISYRLVVEKCNAMSCLRSETTIVYDVINKRFVKENDFLPAENLEAFTSLLQTAITREQKLAYNNGQISCNGNFFLDEYGITYVFNSKDYLEEHEAKLYVVLDPKQFRPLLKQESIVYKFFNIGQVERAKAKKQNKPLIK